MRCLSFLLFFGALTMQFCGRGPSGDETASPFDQLKVGEVVDSKYAAFGIGEYNKDDVNAFYVRSVESLVDQIFVAFVKTTPCTPLTCPEEFELFLVKNGQIQQRISASYDRETTPAFRVLHDTYVLYLESRHNWSETEDGNLEYDSAEDYVDGLGYVLRNGSLSSLGELSAPDLRLYRNLVMAKYGYVFNSEDLNQYFTNTDWYTPQPGVDINSVLTDSDKELISYIQRLESSK